MFQSLGSQSPPRDYALRTLLASTLGAFLDCVFHPGLPGIGICVSCQSVVCDGCSTRLQGRNFCSSCWDARAASETKDSPRQSHPVVLAGLSLLTLASMATLVLLGVVFGFSLYVLG